MPGLIAIVATVNAYLRAKLIGADSERGSVTIEHVMWAVGVIAIAIAGIVILAITNYVTGQAAQIR